MALVFGMLSLWLWDIFPAWLSLKPPALGLLYSVSLKSLLLSLLLFLLSSLPLSALWWIRVRTSEEFGVLFAPNAVQLASSQCLPGLISAAFTDVPATLLPSGSKTVQQAERTLTFQFSSVFRTLCFSLQPLCRFMPAEYFCSALSLRPQAGRPAEPGSHVGGSSSGGGGGDPVANWCFQHLKRD